MSERKDWLYYLQQIENDQYDEIGKPGIKSSAYNILNSFKYRSSDPSTRVRIANAISKWWQKSKTEALPIVQSTQNRHRWEELLERVETTGGSLTREERHNLAKKKDRLKQDNSDPELLDRIEKAIQTSDELTKQHQWKELLKRVETTDVSLTGAERKQLVRKRDRLMENINTEKSEPDVLARVVNAIKHSDARKKPRPGANYHQQQQDRSDTFEQEFLTDSEDDSAQPPYHPPITPVYHHEEFPFTADDDVTDKPPPLFDGLLQSIDALHLRVKKLESSLFY